MSLLFIMVVSFVRKPKIKFSRDPAVVVWRDCRERHVRFHWGDDPEEDFDIDYEREDLDYKTKKGES